MILRKKDSNMNFGFSFPAFNENLIMDISFIKGNTINFTIAFGLIYQTVFLANQNIKEKNRRYLAIKIQRKLLYKSLNNLNKKGLYLQSADLKGDDLDITISNSHIEVTFARPHMQRILHYLLPRNSILI